MNKVALDTNVSDCLFKLKLTAIKALTLMNFVSTKDTT